MESISDLRIEIFTEFTQIILLDLLMLLSDFVGEPETRNSISIAMIIVINTFIGVHLTRIILTSGINIKNWIRKKRHQYKVKKANQAKQASEMAKSIKNTVLVNDFDDLEAVQNVQKEESSE